MAIGRKLVRTSKPKRASSADSFFSSDGGNENVNLDQTTRLLGISLLSGEGSALVAGSRTHCHLVNHLKRFVLRAPSKNNRSGSQSVPPRGSGWVKSLFSTIRGSGWPRLELRSGC